MKYTLKDLLDIPKLQSLLESLEAIHSMPAAIVDTDGTVLAANAWHDTCAAFRRTDPETGRVLIECNCAMEGKWGDTGIPGMYSCPKGLVDASLPIILEGVHVGDVFTGHLFLAIADDTHSREQIHLCGTDRHDHVESLNKVPLFPEEDLTKNVTFLRDLAHMLADQGLKGKRKLELQDALSRSERKFRSVTDAFPLPKVSNGNCIIRARDITQRKLLGEQLKVSEENYRTFSTLTSDFVHRCTRTGNDPYRIQWAGGDLRAVFGYDLEEIRRAGCWFPFVHPEDRASVSSHLLALVPGDRRTMEFRMIKKRGEIVWISETCSCVAGKPGGHLIHFGAAWDITERRKYENAFRVTRASIEVASDAIFWVTPDGWIVDVNPAACSALGYTREEMLELCISDLDPQFTGEAWNSHFCKLRDCGQMKFETEQRAKNGRTLPVEVVTNYLSLGDEELICFFVRDISERMQAEAERVHLEEQMLHVQKHESLGVLAGGIAHDFNNILTIIIGNADLAMTHLSPESPALENLQIIEQAAARAADLAHQMLAYSGKGKFVTEAIDLNRLVEDTGHMLAASLSRKAALHFKLNRPLPAVNVDAAQIRQVIMNLVRNASEAIGEKCGIITVSTGCRQCDKKYLHGNLPEGPYVFVEVTDTGCGMSKETLEKIFDPFFSTKFTGRGLGLAAVLGIIRGHNGSIKVRSERGKGSSFRVLLPASETPAAFFNEARHQNGWK